MQIRAILLALGLLLVASAHAEVWRWVDEQGVIHFSDTPREGAERVDVSSATRDTGARLYRNARPGNNDDSAGDAAEPPFRYASLSVASPGSEETLWNIGGTLNVSLALSPGLQPGHQVRVYFDGQAQMVNGTSFTLEEVHRGVHNIQAEVLDETGTLMIRSQPNRFYVQQNSVVNPVSPIRRQ